VCLIDYIMNLHKIFVTDRNHARKGKVASSCEHSNAASGSIKGREFLD
jgi:hypothetical protein